MKNRIALVAVLCLTAAAVADDWPQWRGPNRDGVSKETGLLKSWPTGGPKLAWTFNELGVGFSGPAVVGNRIYLAGTKDKTEYLFALDTTGKKLWEAKLGPTFDFQGNSYSAGPSSTAVVDGDLLYVVSSGGDLVCVDTKGAVKWSKSMPKDLGGEVDPIGGAPPKMGWGYAWSPLVDGDNVICVPGGPRGVLAALNKKTGELVWQSKDAPAQATYSSPVIATVGGIRHCVQVVPNGVVGIAAADGKLVWEHRLESNYQDVVCPTPIVHDGHVFTTAWYGPNELIKITAAGGKLKADLVYSKKDLNNIQGGVVLVGNHVYGFHDKRNWVCLDFKTGAVSTAWRAPARGTGPGSVVVADGMLYLLSDSKTKGGLLLVEANPEKYVEKGKADLPEPSALRKGGVKLWTHPVVANGKLYIRDQEMLHCYDVK